MARRSTAAQFTVFAVAAIVAACSSVPVEATTASSSTESELTPSAALATPTPVPPAAPTADPTPTPTPTPRPTPTPTPISRASPGGGAPAVHLLDSRPGPRVSCAPIGEDADGISTALAWLEGEVREQLFFSTRSESQLQPPGASPGSETPITLTVLSTTPDLTFEWLPGATDLASFGLDLSASTLPPELVVALEAGSPRTVYSLNAFREFQAIENIDEVRDAIAGLMVALADVVPEMAQARTFIEQMSDDQVALMASADLQLLHALEGLELSISDTLTIEGSLPNVFGGPPIPAIATVELSDLIDRDGCVQIVATTTFADDAGAIILESAAQAFGVTDLENPAEMAEVVASAESFNIEARIEAQYDATIERFRAIAMEERIDAGGQTRIDRDYLIDITSD